MRTGSWLGGLSAIAWKALLACVLTCVTDKSLLVVPGDVGRSDTVTLVVDENLDLSALHDTNTRVGSSKIDTDDGTGNGLFAAVLGSGIGAEEHHRRKEHQKEVEDG